MTSKIDPSAVAAVVVPSATSSSIQSRSQLSFRTINPDTGEAVSVLECSDAAWDVPRGLPKDQADQLGRKYFAEWLELAKNNPEEARKALIEIFLYGWRTPLMIKSPKKTKTEKVMVMGETKEIATRDQWVFPDVAGDFQVEWSFLIALARAALGGAN